MNCNKPCSFKQCPKVPRHGCACCPFRKVVIPEVLGDDSEGSDYAPENGAYQNALVEYKANGAMYIYSSDGIYTKVTGWGGGATVFYADLQNVQHNLSIYAGVHQSDNVGSAAMIAALNRGPVMIQDMNDNNIYVTVVSANGSSNPVSIVIDMYDDHGDPARRRFEYNGPEWTENPF